MPEKRGRKNAAEELMIMQRYADLSEPYFNLLKKKINSKDKKEQEWAAGELGKAFIRMIPQDITSGGEKLNVYDNNQIATIVQNAYKDGVVCGSAVAGKAAAH